MYSGATSLENCLSVNVCSQVRWGFVAMLSLKRIRSHYITTALGVILEHNANVNMNAYMEPGLKRALVISTVTGLLNNPQEKKVLEISAVNITT